ncbi:DNA translocase FtsK [Methylobacterium sp. GC_Met_2]|uniref:DNA translocase FtsK n=3 Tax=unclassified Methylobacterium TaxID=2615210 RepID=UPI00226B76B9|nr:DNA translocase FtsK [Methylobacterium sp. GC_Met_2]
MALRASLTRRLSGSPAGLPARPAHGAPGRRAEPSWLTTPAAMVGRDMPERSMRPRAATPEHVWPDEVFDDRARLDASEAPVFESRIDRSASSPGVLVRQPRRPAAIAPEQAPDGAPLHAPVPAPHPAMTASAVRYTRTPDSVLQERRQRALEAERVALERARAEAQAAALAQEAERTAREQAEHEQAERARTADAQVEQVVDASVLSDPAHEAEVVPLWRQPFVAPPGVRFFRTPDRRPARPAVELAASTAVIAPVAVASIALEPAIKDMVAQTAVIDEAALTQVETAIEAPARDWSDLPDWSGVQPWFGGGDWSSVEAWAALEPQPAEAAPVPATFEPAVSMTPDAVQPPRPVYVLDRLVRFDQPPRPADGQDNGRMQAPETVQRDDADAAIRSAFLPSAPTSAPAGLSLVFGPGSATADSHTTEVPTTEAPRRPPMLSAMAARAAIRAAGQPSSAPALPLVQAEAVAVAPAVSGPEQAEVERVVIPMTPRPVLLRGKLAPQPESVQPEPVSAEIEAEGEAEVEAAPVASLIEPVAAAPVVLPMVASRAHLIPAGRHLEIASIENADYELPSLELLALPAPGGSEEVDADVLEQNALNLQQTVQDFGVRGDILAVRPGPVVTLYELEPAPGTKSSRVIGLSDDIARSMSAVSARVAVVPGRNVIGIELPNETRETVYLRELLASADFAESKHKLALCLGKNIGGEPIIADLARMPHLLVAGTTGSGKSVAINTMILSLLYRLKPEECRLIMVDPKMLELSVYDGIPHLLSPVVIDPKKAVIALKWAVREMEERYKKMSKIAVRNIDGYNARMKEAREKGETITRTIQTGFDRHTGEAVFVDEAMDLSPLPYIVIVVDEMADLMMVAGKDIEGAIQRLAQMARAAGIHLIMATQRPSVDVITGTIKANFPTRISFQVTSKIDSRTILGEMGAEQLLGQGDMLFMAGGGRTTRVHGPFCSDSEVETVVAHLKRQGRPSYLDAVTADDGPEEPAKEGGRSGRGSKSAAADRADRSEEPAEEAPVFDIGAFAAATGGDSDDLYKQAIEVVLRDEKASTSYIQRRLQIGYNRAASIMERMEIEGIVGPANHAGKREILVTGASHSSAGMYDDE